MAAGVMLCAGCTGPQSALDPAGYEASRISELFIGMTIASVAIWIAVVGLALYASVGHRRIGPRRGRILIIAGGVLFPIVVLGILLSVGLSMLRDLLGPAPAEALRIEVTGHQWWWGIRYHPAGGEPVDVANELHLPAGRAVLLELDASDVIHSFWIPSLAGKVDMIPGRRTRLLIHPERVGKYGGACAEFCGTSHALMRFPVIVDSQTGFDRWLVRQGEAAVVLGDPVIARGAGRFIANGCGGCHTIRGTEARGVIGPDLTHVGSRLTIGAGVLASDLASIRTFIANTDSIKPGVLMPHFGMLPDEELRALASFLVSLK